MDLKLYQGRKIIVEKTDAPSRFLTIAITLFSIVLGLICGLLFLFALGFDALHVYQKMFSSAFLNLYGFSETIVKTIPLLLCGLAVGFAGRIGLWNIGAEGQFYMGAFAATGIALYVMPDAPSYLVIPAMIAAGMAAGALWGLLGIVPLVFWRVNEIITTLMLNYIAILWVDYLIYGPWRNPQHGFPLSLGFGSNARLPSFGDTRVHLGLVLAVIAVIVIHLILNKTKWGFEIKVIGGNKRSAEYSGIPIVRNLVYVMLLGAAFAGLAGMTEVSGICFRLQPNLSPGYGYSGIVVAWLAKLNPFGIAFMSLLFAGLLVGGYSMQAEGVPIGIVNVLQATILFFVLAGELFTRYRISLDKKDFSG